MVTFWSGCFVSSGIPTVMTNGRHHTIGWGVSYLALSTGSTPTVGSSRIRSSGFCSRAAPRDTRRLWPPLGHPGGGGKKGQRSSQLNLRHKTAGPGCFILSFITLFHIGGALYYRLVKEQVRHAVLCCSYQERLSYKVRQRTVSTTSESEQSVTRSSLKTKTPFHGQ